MIAKHLDSWLVVLALALAPALWLARGHGLVPGSSLEVDLTLITPDKHDLSCALATTIAEHHCRFRAPGRAFDGESSRVGVLQPFVTLQGAMFLLPDLFQQREVAQRYAREIPDGRPRTEFRRFTAHCRLKVLQWVSTAEVQFGPTAVWARAPALWVAEPVSCHVTG